MSPALAGGFLTTVPPGKLLKNPFTVILEGLLEEVEMCSIAPVYLNIPCQPELFNLNFPKYLHTTMGHI